MDARLRNRYYMMQRVNRIMEEYQSVWETEPKLVLAATQLREKLGEIQRLFTVQQEYKHSWKDVAESHWNKLVTQALTFQGQLLVLAEERGDEALKTVLGFAKNDLRRQSFQRSRNNFKAVLDGLEVHAEALNTTFPNQVGEREAFVAEVKSMLETDPALLARRGTLREITTQLKEVQKSVVALLRNQVDLLMRPFAQAAPEFHRQYQLGRIIPKLPSARNGGPTALIAEVFPEEGGENTNPTGLPGGDAPPSLPVGGGE